MAIKYFRSVQFKKIDTVMLWLAEFAVGFLLFAPIIVVMWGIQNNYDKSLFDAVSKTFINFIKHPDIHVILIGAGLALIYSIISMQFNINILLFVTIVSYILVIMYAFGLIGVIITGGLTAFIIFLYRHAVTKEKVRDFLYEIIDFLFRLEGKRDVFNLEEELKKPPPVYQDYQPAFKFKEVEKKKKTPEEEELERNIVFLTNLIENAIRTLILILLGVLTLYKAFTSTLAETILLFLCFVMTSLYFKTEEDAYRAAGWAFFFIFFLLVMFKMK
ncbi:MAG: hypothetical protein CVV21_00510 [Candidatus Goldiibacteriota bacterium HGW-Goldbacteria-1]|jgi:hypothetical protein|nr:MAG: hypothetical protein CVV21_00510 [Candidatus Goldiibacteriota bacterium HGW-Goldbacteria-1]